MRSLLPLLIACSASPPDPASDGLSLVVTTFNTGTTEARGEDGPDDGYGPDEARISDTWYGDGLAWLPVVADTRAWLATARPDVLGFQEIFWPGDCPDIPAEHHAGWFCEGWAAGDPTVAEHILGPDYQVACQDGKPDKCLAVRTELGTFAGCEGSFCLEGLDGAEVDGCGSGSRVGRGVIELARGGTLTVVNVHGSSGLTPDDRDCRVRQFELVFEDLDGAPAASGSRNVVLGDFNTDPRQNIAFDPSAAYLASQATGDWAFVTDNGPDAEPTYAGLFNIDHVLSDAFDGDCTADPDVTPVAYFDHQPITCVLTER